MSTPESRQYRRLVLALKHLLDGRARLHEAGWRPQAHQLTPLIEEISAEVAKLWTALEGQQ